MDPVAKISPEDIADEESALELLYARALATAGITSHNFSDQGSSHDIDQLHKEIARREARLANARRGTTTRYGAVSKGV